ncbi:unnamed protein product, partial [Owenia fusiformis]
QRYTHTLVPMKPAIYVYRGLGASEQGLSMLLNALKRWCCMSTYDVIQISPQEIITGEWCKNASLLAIGGGYDRGFIKALGPTGMHIIKQYVQSGGRYLGICAGGYFGSQEIQFDKDGPLQVCGERDLGFYQGLCVGPAYGTPPYKYNSEQGAQAACIKWNTLGHKSNSTPINISPNHNAEKESTSVNGGKTVFNYFNGGGFFTCNDGCHRDIDSYYSNKDCSITTLATYMDLPETPAAIVKCSLNKGICILTGIHFEYLVEKLNLEDSDLKNVIPKLQSSVREREECFRFIMDQLGITCK